MASRDTGDPGIQGWTIFLDSNANGTLDAGEVFTETDIEGNYIFNGLLPGQYTVSEVQLAGWTQTTPLPSTVGVDISTAGSTIVMESLGCGCGGNWATSTGPAVIDYGVLSINTALDTVGITGLRAQPGYATLDGRGVSTVVIDTGIDLNHSFFGPDLNSDGISDRIIYQYDFANGDNDASDVNGHGSHIASLIGAQDALYKGVAPGTDIIALKVFDDSGRGYFSYLEQALQWVIANHDTYHVGVVNLSLGDGGNWIDDFSRYGLGDEFAALAQTDVIVIAAAGNNYLQFGRMGVAYPASDPAVISVGATWAADFGGPWTVYTGATNYSTGVDQIAAFSQRDTALLDTFVPGARFNGANANGGIQTMQGTSQASAFASGAAALAQQIAWQTLGRGLTTGEFADLLRSTGDLITDGDDEIDNVVNTGLQYPRLNFEKLAARIATLGTVTPGGGSTGGTGGGGSVNLSQQAADGVHNVTLVAGGVSSGLDFGNFKLGEINGTVFDDLNGDGILNGSEAGLQSWIVFLDSNKNGLADTDEASVHTNVNGHYSFANLGPVSQRVALVKPDGWTHTTASFFDVTVNSGQIVTDNFGVKVTTSNTAPVAVADTLGATEDTTVNYTALQLLGNDSDADGNSLSIASVAQGSNGFVVLNGDGTVTFTLLANFNGVADFSYIATDGTDLSNSALVTVNVAAVNDAPVAVADTLSATEDTPVTFTAVQLLGNDTDVENDSLTIASVAQGSNGFVVLNSNGSVTFTPAANFTGVADFSYIATDGTDLSNSATVTVNVAAAGNTAPVAVDDTLTATEDTSFTYTALQLLGNDTDADGNNLAIASVTSGSNGTAALNQDGTVTFTPNADFNGAANFSYTATDGALTSNSATVTVNVTAVNDAPVAVADTLSATEDTPVTYTAVQLLGNDTDVENDSLTIASVAQGSNGFVVLNSNGSVTFTPAANFNGVADFSYIATDGTDLSNSAKVTVNVTAVNDAPVAVADTLSATEDTPVTYTAVQLLGNDTDVENDSLTIASVAQGSNGTVVLNGNGSVTFTPAANFNGVADFSYIATDGIDLSNSATVTVNVTAVNDAPVAVADTLSATEDTPVTYTAAQLLGNDTDVENDSLTIASVAQGSNGTVVLNSNGTLTFTPAANFNGVADFSYIATDGTDLSNSATVTVNVTAVNDAPVAVADTLSATEDTPVTYTAAQLLGNDTDVENDSLTIASVAQGSNGTVVLNSNGTVTFTPAANFNGVADFSYIATDGIDLSNSATVTVNVAAAGNTAPVAVDDTLTATEDTPFTYTALQLLGNDTDADGNNLAIASVTSGSNGTAALNLDGTVTFTPNADFNGAANFSYTATDGALTSNSATVTVNVTAVNDAPVAVADTLSATEDTPVIYTAAQLLGNDTDVEHDSLTIASVAQGSNGTVVLNSDGTVTFTPDANFNGVADFSYVASDGTDLSNSATVTVNVAAVPDYLTVSSFNATATGFHVQFNHAFNPTVINLYGAADQPADVVLTGQYRCCQRLAGYGCQSRRLYLHQDRWCAGGRQLQRHP